MKSLLQTFLLVVTVFALAVAVDRITPLKRFTDYLNQNPEPYRTVMLGMSIAGWTVLLVVFFHALWTRGRPMSGGEAQEFMCTGVGRPKAVRVFAGRVIGREFRMEATFREIKEAFHNGAWLRDPSWRPISFGLFGAAMAVCGMFGYFFVIGPPLVKLLCSATLAYAAARTGWGFWKA